MWNPIYTLFLALPCILAFAEIEKPWLKSIITQERPDVEEIVSLTLSPLDLPGTIYGCNRTRANMVLQLKDKSQISKSVVVIALPSDPLREKQISESGLFEVDVNVYKNVLPRMEEFLNKTGLAEKKIWVTALALEGASRLVVEDWEEQNYKLVPRWDGLDMEQCKTSVENLARFHALSAALESQGIITAKKSFDLSLGQRNKDKIGDWYGKVFEEFAKSIRAAWGAGFEKIAEYFDEKSKTITNDILKIMKRDDSKFNALLNGAFDINNIYFKNDENQKPVGIRTVNFQNAFWNSPALDLQHFLNTSPKPELIGDDSKRGQIVEHYVKTLVKSLKDFGYEKSITEEEVASEIERTELVGIANAINVLSGLYMKAEDAAYADDFIKEALKTKQIKIDSRGMVLPKFVEVMKKIVNRSLKLGVCKC